MKNLVRAYLNSNSPKRKKFYKDSVEAQLKTLKFETLGKAKRETTLSYIGSVNSSAKIIKNLKENYHTYIIYMLPAAASGYNVCPMASEGCIKACLNTSGRVKMDTEQKILTARLLKTWLFYSNRTFFMEMVVAEIESAKRKANREGANFSARINGTSDLSLETYKLDGQNVLQLFPNVQFYDYTKVFNRLKMTKKYDNYDLTFSYSGTNLEECKSSLEQGYRVAVPFLIKKGEDLPESFLGHSVGDADETDLRFLDKKRIAGLRVKITKDRKAIEAAVADGFVVDPSQVEIYS